MGARDHTVFLMYHVLQRPGRSLCSADPGYVRYVVEETEFRAQLSRMRSGACAAVERLRLDRSSDSALNNAWF
jgi:hypothetical protein